MNGLKRGGLQSWWLWALVAALLAWSIRATHAEIRIQTEFESYVVSPGEAFDIRVFLDADSASPGIQPLPSGLFSFGVELQFDPGTLAVDALHPVTVPEALNFIGFDSGAAEQSGPGFVGVKGNIDPLGTAPSYAGALLATFRVQDVSGGGSYAVTLAPYRTLGAAETLFVDGSGADLDASLQFGSAHIGPIPEPSIAWTMLIGLVVLGVAGLCRRRIA